jgi:outer membrane protein insertion porin family
VLTRLAVPLVLLAAVVAPAAAQQPPPPAAPYVGKSVVTIALAVEGRPSTDPALLETVQIKLNRPLDMQDVRETMTHLYTLGRFDDVQVEAEAAPGGVAVTVLLDPIHIVTRIDFKGELGLPEATLLDRIADRFGATPPLSRSGDVAAALQQLYQEYGYMNAAVRPGAPILEHQPERATMVLDVTAGPRALIGHAQVNGAPLEPAAKVEERLHIAPGQPYQSADLRTRLADYVTWMRSRGYYEADARQVDARFRADKTAVDLSVEVRPGPLVKVEFSGDPLPAGKRAELVPIEREGSVDEDILEDAAHRITEYLQQQGYWKASVPAPERKEEGDTLAIVFHVDRGQLFHVAPGGVQISGVQRIPPEELKTILKTLAEGAPFMATNLGRIEGAIKEAYLRQGYAIVDVQSQPNQVGPALVQPSIVVKEGPLVRLGTISVTGNEKIASTDLLTLVSADIGDRKGLRTGFPYYGPTVADARDRILARYQDDGFQSADVTVAAAAPVVTADGGRADVVFQVHEGLQTRVEHIFITGNVKTDQGVIRRELRIGEGKPLGATAVSETRRNLSALGLFRRIQINAVSHGDPSRSDVIVAVEEAQQTTVDYGGGVQVERALRDAGNGNPTQVYEFAPRGFFEIGRRNIGGKNRFANLYTRFGLRPSTDPQDSNPFGFSEYRVVGTYREPRAFHNFGELTSTGAIEQGVRTGFNFVRKGVNAELGHRVSDTVRVSGQYAFTTTHIIDEVLTEDERLTVDRVFSQVRLSSFAGAISRDTRDDLIAPQHGTLLSADGTMAAQALGSEVTFLKLFLQGFAYQHVGRSNTVFAGGVRLGLGHPKEEIVDGELVRDLPASERFFAGGDSTIRGFARDSVGAPSTLTVDGFPRGGDAEIILNGELRVPVKGKFGAVVFADGGNVFSRAADLNLGDLRWSMGFGGRYRSPIGPLRLDIGFPLDRQFIGNTGSLEKRFQIHFSMGQAF